MNTLACCVKPTPVLSRSWREPALNIRLAGRWRHTLLRLARATLSCALLGLMLAGCGSPGTPQPPSLKLPIPPTDLSASRVGNSVTLHWTMPRRATDRVLLNGDQRAVICRSLVTLPPTAPCSTVSAVLLAAGKPASYTDTLPADLTTGLLRPLVYTVLLQNHKERDAGPSNAAYIAAGAAPPPIAEVHADAIAAGINLHWQPDATAPQAGVHYLLRLHRTRLLAPGETTTSNSGEAQAGVPQPLEQTLEVPPAAGAGAMAAFRNQALDPDAVLNRTYRYTVERVARLSLEGRAVEVSGPLSEPVTIEAHDLFPPGVPQGLEAVADVEGGAIDLSWTADADADLAGYYVYRRDLHKSEPSSRVSGAELLPNAAWRDEHTQPGARYAYSVSAVDTSGNESARSREEAESVRLLPAGTLPAVTHPM